MKKIFGTILFLLFFFINAYGMGKSTTSEIVVSPTYHANKYKRVAVFPFNTTKPEQYNLTISDQLSTSFMKLGYTVVERTQLQAILKELKIELTGLIKQSDLVRIGKILSIDAIVMGSLEYDYTGVYWWLRSGTMRMIDVTTGEVIISIFSNSYNGDIQTVVNDINNLMKKEKLTGR